MAVIMCPPLYVLKYDVLDVPAGGGLNNREKKNIDYGMFLYSPRTRIAIILRVTAQ